MWLLLMESFDYWRDNNAPLPKWSEAAKKIMLIQPSSAAAEHVVSLLKKRPATVNS